MPSEWLGSRLQRQKVPITPIKVDQTPCLVVLSQRGPRKCGVCHDGKKKRKDNGALEIHYFNGLLKN